MDITSNDPSFDIRTLYNNQVSRKDHRQETYNILVRRAHHRIKTVAQRNEVQCIFQLPQIIVGSPLYDPFECCGYLIKTLKQQGFLVKYFHPNILYINWSREVIEPRVRELNARDKTKQKQEQQKTVREHQNGTKNLLNGLPTVNLDYTPTGKLFM